jgi:hypothetical protein
MGEMGGGVQKAGDQNAMAFLAPIAGVIQPVFRRLDVVIRDKHQGLSRPNTNRPLLQPRTVVATNPVPIH